jgi:hypothetical protein
MNTSRAAGESACVAAAPVPRGTPTVRGGLAPSGGSATHTQATYNDDPAGGGGAVSTHEEGS